MTTTTYDLMDFKTFLTEHFPIKEWNNGMWLSNATVREVKHRLEKGDRPKVIAMEMGILLNTIYRIRRGETYKEVE